MANENKVLVIGATGSVGREAVRAVLAQGGEVRALVRSAASAEALGPGVEAVVGDLRDDASIARALHSVRAALYTAPHTTDEEALATRFIAACERAGVRLVYASVHADGATRAGRALKRFVYGLAFPHYRPKFRNSERARVSRTRAIVLVATNYFQNDELFREEILSGAFVNVFERAINRVDVRDIGAAAARALLDDSLPAGAYPIVGPRSLTGRDCAAIWSAALGREVRWQHDVARVYAAIRRELTDKKRDDFLASYKLIQHFGVPTKPELLARTTELLGRAPIDYAEYVREQAERLTNGRGSAAA